MRRTGFSGLGLLLSVLGLTGCPPATNPPSPPQIITRPAFRPTVGPSNSPPADPSYASDIVRWEGETGYYYTSRSTAGTGILANRYAMTIVFNGGPILAGDTIFVKDASGQEMEKIDVTAAPDTNKNQYAIGFSNNPSNPNNPYYYLVISPQIYPANALDHGAQLKYSVVDQNSAGSAETPLTITYIAPNRCMANSIQVSNTMPMKNDAVTVTWDAQGCKAAVVTSSSGSGSVIGGLGGAGNTIAGPYIFANASPQYNSSFTGAQTTFQIQQDTTYEVNALDAIWHNDSKSVTAKVQQPPQGHTPSTGCPGNAQPQTFDFHVTCSLGCYSYSGYRACSKSAGMMELQNEYGGCTVSDGSTCPQ